MLKLITPPAALPVDLTEVKMHLRVTHNEEDSLIVSYMAAATARLDGAEGYLGRCLLPQTWEYTQAHFSGPIRLPLPPCQSIDAITYTDTTGTAVVLDPAAYEVAGLSTGESAIIYPLNGWPATASRPDAVKIRFTAGSDTVPEPIRTAILARVLHLYDNRDSVVIGESAGVMPMGEEDLIQNYRGWAF